MNVPALEEAIAAAFATWFEYTRFKFSIFSVPQARAIVAYLEHRKRLDELAAFQRTHIEQALENYWYGKAGPR